MEVYDQLFNVECGLLKLLGDVLINNTSLLILARKSLMEPFHITTLDLMFNFSTSFAFNAIFFS